MYLEEEMKSAYNEYVFSFNREITTFILVYNENLEEQNKTAIYKETIPIGTELYEFAYKILHLKGNTEVFLYMNKKIFVINYNQENKQLKNYFPEPDFSYIELLFTDDRSKYLAKFFTELIKISDSKLCYISSPSSNYDSTKYDYLIFIALLNFIGNQTMIARYYYININRLFGFSIRYSCKFNIYNDYIALSFSSETIEYGNQAAFMLLSYANNTNQNFDIIDHLLNFHFP